MYVECACVCVTWFFHLQVPQQDLLGEMMGCVVQPLRQTFSWMKVNSTFIRPHLSHLTCRFRYLIRRLAEVVHTWYSGWTTWSWWMMLRVYSFSSSLITEFFFFCIMLRNSFWILPSRGSGRLPVYGHLLKRFYIKNIICVALFTYWSLETLTLI